MTKQRVFNFKHLQCSCYEKCARNVCYGQIDGRKDTHIAVNSIPPFPSERGDSICFVSSFPFHSFLYHNKVLCCYTTSFKKIIVLNKKYIYILAMVESSKNNQKAN